MSSPAEFSRTKSSKFVGALIYGDGSITLLLILYSTLFLMQVSVHNIDYHSLGTVGDMLHKLKSKVQLSRPNAELRLLLIRFNVIQKIYPLSERFNNLPTTWSLRAEEVLEEERHKGPRDKMIHVCHINTEAFAGKMNKYPYNGGNFGHPFLLVIHEEETLADIKLHLQKKFQVPDDAFFKWKSAGGKYFQDSDILYHHFEGINDWSNKGRSHFSCLCLEHSYNSWKTTSAANQFHSNCIDPWLRQQGTCPVCKFRANEWQEDNVNTEIYDGSPMA